MDLFIEPATILSLTGLSVLLAAFLVAGRFSLCIYHAFIRQHYGTVCIAIGGVVCAVLLLAAVATVWFGYAVAHTGKDTMTDLNVFLATVPPFFLLEGILWFLGGRLMMRLRELPEQ